MGHPAIENKTPYAFEPLHLLDEEARPLLVTVVKATFAIGADGRCAVAEQQLPLNLEGEPFGEDPELSSYKYEPEVAFFKPSTDVVLNGHAYAPRAGTTQTLVSFRVGPVQKQARVSGDRVWFRVAGQVSATGPIEFERIPLQYERAFGGWDRTHPDVARHTFEPRNPVGASYRAGGKFEEGVRLPNLEDPKAPIRSYGDRRTPTAFGFVSPHWQPRAALAGTYDERWQKDRSPLLPKDFDRRHLSAASPGLVAPAYLRGDETVVAIGVTPAGSLSFALPGATPPDVRVAVRDGADRRLRTNLDTVIVEPDEMRVLLFWRAHLALPTGPHDVAAIEVTAASAPR
jgi:hypothetical protein